MYSFEELLATMTLITAAEIEDKIDSNQDFVLSVPGLMVVKNGTIKVKCDSKMTKEEIREFIG